MSREVDIKALVSHIVRGDGADKCRICLGDTTDGQVYLGDTVMMDGERPITLSELLETITGVKITEETQCPPGSCITCTTALLAAQEFRHLVQSSVKLWTTAIETISLIPNPITTVKSLCVVVSNETLGVQIFKDYYGGDPKTVVNRLTGRSAKKHVTISNDRKPRNSLAFRAGPSCGCTDCGQQFPSPYHLSLHLKNSGHKEVCMICGEIVMRGQEMQNHLSAIHEETTYLCPRCPLWFNNELDLKTHRKMAHKHGALTCGDCGRTFTRSGAFEAHSQMHAVRTCRACGRQFTNRTCYRRHRAQCEPGAKPDKQDVPKNRRCNIRDPAVFICDYCGKTYQSRPQLKNHIIWIHMNVRPHQCQFCPKRFYTPARLAEHKVVHTRERNFECDICGMKLVSRMAAIYHRRRHTGERPYECVDCDEKFISASRRSEHAKRRHNKGFRHHCGQCAATFVRTHELRKHELKAHPVSLVDGKTILNL